MRILHTSDWHVGRRLRGRDRGEEHESVLGEIVGVAGEQVVDLVVVSGDVFDTTSPTPASERIVFGALLDLAGVAPVVVVAGNHDSPQRLDALAPLLRLGRVSVLGAPARPGEGGLIDIPELDVKIAMLPFVSTRGIVKVVDLMGSDPDEHSGLYSERMKAVIAGLTGDMTADTVNLLVAHLTVFDAKHGGGERLAHTVFDYAVPASVFPGHLSYVALGHLHRQQKIPHPGAVWYSGSPLQLDFGEVDDQKGVLLVEASPGKPAKVTTIPVTSGRPLRTIRGTLDQVFAMAHEVEGSYVRVVLTEKARVGLADEVRAIIPDAVEVTLERTEEAEASTVAQRQSMEPLEAFHRYLADRGEEDDEVEELFSRLFEEAVG